MVEHLQRGSASLREPGYWWYRARARLLESVLGGYLGDPGLVLDVGSADGPSVGWMKRVGQRYALDIHPGGLEAGHGVCGTATALPFRDRTFDVVAAFDVVEHCQDEARAVAELHRVLRPGGRLLLSVPAYQWAWSDHDVRAGHYRRYTRRRIVRAVERSGLRVERSTYAFSAVFPLFVAERVVRKARERTGRAAPPGLTPVSPALDRVLTSLSRAEARVLLRRDLPFGSSVLLAAVKPR
ncbi:class I SAM-dependent methyltransferase [Nocardioides guangzhouensis]|uniref:Class I SAM-dependent methyltransferase n=1 Tax=Nocardioides guangzhouensis TaxID=2497878 RepID=A0A4Q4ZBI0_9ACTN|nr:class I SAM-dependent methyltransferase [Nocardioides guangzhouensis]RYP85350.1 class I SAM-dependent methyltransferase [Nocardioides guangzhouensis]